MDRTLILLLLALFLTWLAWRAARRQAVLERARRQVELDRGTCTLEPVETSDGRGFVAVLSGGERSDRVWLNWQEHDVEIASIEGFPASAEAADSPAFTPGADVEVILDDDERTLRVWDEAMTMPAGTLPPDTIARIDPDTIGACVVVWEHRTDGRRTGIDVLLVHRDMILDD